MSAAAPSAAGEAAGKPRPIPVGPTFREAVESYRHHLLRVVGVAALVLLPAEVLKGLARVWEEHSSHTAGDLIALGSLTLAEVAVSTAAAALYAGFMDHTVHAIRRGHEPASLGSIARRLPYWRIIGVSLVTGVMVLFGTLLLIVPGVIVYTLVAISGPVVVIEDLGVWKAIRRAIRLTRPRFWRMLVIVTVPTIVEGVVLDAFARWAGHTVVAELVVHVVIAAFAIAFVMLLEVHAAHWILDEAHRDDAAAPGGSPAA